MSDLFRVALIIVIGYFIISTPHAPPITLPGNLFIENCDTVNTSIWAIANPNCDYPTANGGTWIFHYPASTETFILPMTEQKFQYGSYEARIKMSGPKPNSQRYYFYLIDNNGAGSTYGELDMFEVNYWEQRESVSNYRGFSAKGEYYTPTINYDDGQWHTWKFIFTPTVERIYIDNILQYTITETNPKIFPEYPMNLKIGGYNNGSVNQDFTLWVDWIKYTPI